MVTPPVTAGEGDCRTRNLSVSSLSVTDDTGGEIQYLKLLTIKLFIVGAGVARKYCFIFAHIENKTRDKTVGRFWLNSENVCYDIISTLFIIPRSHVAVTGLEIKCSFINCNFCRLV